MPILNYSDCKKGFTLVELLVVMSLTMILTSGLIIYSRSSETQLVLFRDQAKVISALHQAKSSALATLESNGIFVCGYGVHIDRTNNTIIVFRDISSESNCSSADNVYTANQAGCNTPQSECVYKTSLDQTIKFVDSATSVNLNDIIFIPPDLKVIINGNVDTPKASITIGIKTTPSATKEIIVNNSGQISEK